MMDDNLSPYQAAQRVDTFLFEGWSDSRVLDEYLKALAGSAVLFVALRNEVLRRMEWPRTLGFVEADGRVRKIEWDNGDPQSGIPAGYVAAD